MDEASERDTLDAGMAQFNAALAAATPPEAAHWPLERQRDSWNTVCAAFRAPLPDGISILEVNANGVPCRIYRPQATGALPAVIYGHGGGWVLGGFHTHEDMCAELAVGSGAAVVLMDYRLAPEHRHPAQLEDSLKVWRWLREQGQGHGLDTSHLIAAGDSAGGQMSVALALALRDMALPQLAAMVLIYPVLGANTQTPSYLQNANAASLSREEMLYYLRAFLGPEGSAAWTDEKAMPLAAPSLAGLPPAFITVAGHDPLHDDGVMFHDRLLAAGIPSTLKREPKLGHSYMRARHHSAVAMAAFGDIAAALRRFAATR